MCEVARVRKRLRALMDTCRSLRNSLRRSFRSSNRPTPAASCQSYKFAPQTTSPRRRSMRRIPILTLIITALAATQGSAQNLDGLPVYEGNNDQFSEIRIWGNETMLQMLTAWELGIHEHQRGLRFADVLPSGAAAVGALYTGVADLGLMGHHSWPMEILAFNEVYGYDPLEITVATGAYDVPAKMPA